MGRWGRHKFKSRFALPRLIRQLCYGLPDQAGGYKQRSIYLWLATGRRADHMTGQADIRAQRAGLLTGYTSLGWNLSGSLLLTLTQVHFAWG